MPDDLGLQAGASGMEGIGARRLFERFEQILIEEGGLGGWEASWMRVLWRCRAPQQPQEKRANQGW